MTAETVGTFKLFADEVLERTAEMRKDAESIPRNLRALYEGSIVATEQMSKGRSWRREEDDDA